MDYLDVQPDDSDDEYKLFDFAADTLPEQGEAPITPTPAQKQILLPDCEIETYTTKDGVKITTGCTVEIRDHHKHGPGQLHSGDFLRVRNIIQNLEDDVIRIRGFRMRRAKYLGPMFDWKVNELIMALHVEPEQETSPFMYGMEDILVDEVVGVRDCILTHKPYPFLSFRSSPAPSYHRYPSKQECLNNIYHNGRLVCRWLNILVGRSHKKPYAGIVRQIYSHEADPQTTPMARDPGLSKTVLILDNDEEGEMAASEPIGEQYPRSNSVEIVEDIPGKRTVSSPVHKGQYTFGDAFCGAGGASQGAVQANLCVSWGMDKDHKAIQAYTYNHDGASIYLMDAHEFPSKDKDLWWQQLRVDILHLSPPCNYWSPAHTQEGQNDQANYETILTVGPILKKIKPRVATVEQTYGLLTHAEHKKSFLLLINDILKAGYDVRYKLQNIAEFGLAQQRKRLLMIASRRSIPLPPFPKLTHGPGLRPWVSIAKALSPLERSAALDPNDICHNPGSEKVIHKMPYDPDGFLKGCITAGGGDNYHPSGTRKFTLRELALCQSFPYDYKFYGGKGDMTRQIGNAFPPVMAEAMYSTIAQHLEAFDHGLIGAEDCIDDLQAYLRAKGVKLPGSASQPISLLDGPAETELQRSAFRYLAHRVPPGEGYMPDQHSVFARKVKGEPKAKGPKTEARLSSQYRALFEENFEAEASSNSLFRYQARNREREREREQQERERAMGLEDASAYGDQLHQLYEMGFENFDDNMAALQKTGGRVHEAIEHLLRGRN